MHRRTEQFPLDDGTPVTCDYTSADTSYVGLPPIAEQGSDATQVQQRDIIHLVERLEAPNDKTTHETSF